MKLPHILRYTDGVEGGKQFAFVIRINPKYKDDKGLFAHEYEHLKQWYIFLIISSIIVYGGLFYGYHIFSYFVAVPLVGHNLLYRFKAYRRWSEVKAFRKQLEHYTPDKINWAANHLARYYQLDITVAEAKRLLTK
jgi:hypothetical protein